ncbi:Trithorax group protein osa [Araneus ventricosus]|uniref:Trithorax group protein osa n=1 Tax=Araneus ventricosus TaxID=182803 RepID=A0A4Y2QK01_ARAVE|nr:Trithorax group protein osa [Araneus ventricosus]
MLMFIVANSNYEFANIKRPENLLKLYTLSDEPDRRYFLDKLIVFNEDRGSPITQCPTISKQPLDVFRVYLTVKERGGFVEVTNAKRWKDIAGAIGVGASSSAAYTLRKQYMKLLLPFECKFDRGGIDPQPIINMVEASSRKKGKNSPANSYGNQTHYSQGYPQPVERYHSGYPASYQSPRYPCNNNAMDYQCTSNAMHYPQTAPNNVPHNSGSGQGQYNQYSQSSASNYRYYQGNNPTASAGYNSNMPNNISDNLCRYGRSATSTPVPQEQGYYSHQYSTPQQGQNIQDIYNSGRGCSMQENLNLPAANQIANDLQQMEQLASYSAVNNAVDTSSLKSDASQLPKSSSDSFGTMNMDVTVTNSVTDSLQDKTCLKTSYSTTGKTITSDATPIVTKCFTPTTPAPQSYQQSIPENLRHAPFLFGLEGRKAWLSEQNQHQYQHVGQRPQLKPPVNNTSEGKQLPEPSRSRKSWLSFQNSSQIQNKHQSVSAPIPNQNQTFLTAKTQPQPNVTPSAPQALQPVVKKPFEFPPNTVESIRPVAVKRRRCPAKRLGPIDPWRLMLALKSGLLAESTWALDAIAILLADNNTVVYFNLDHMPGLLNVLVDHYRCFLNKIFDLAKDMELGSTTVSDKKLHNDQFPLGSSDIFNWESKTKILDTPNFTYKTRCKKKIEIQYDEALFLIDPQRSWDVYEDFEVSSEHWQKGGGDITSHIQTCFAEETKKVKFCRELSNEKTKDTSENHVIKDKSKMWKSSLLYKGEPVVVLKKCNLDTSKITTVSCSGSDIDADDSCSINSISSNFDKKIEFSPKKVKEEKDPSESNDSTTETENKNSSKCPSSITDKDEQESKTKPESNVEESGISIKKENCGQKKENSDNVKENTENPESDKENLENIPRLRGSLSSRKRFLCEDLEDEAYCFDQPALCVMSDSQEMLSRRCVCVSTILRNLSFVPGNDIIMSKNPGVLVLLGRLLLLHHEHKPAKNAYHKYEKELDGNSTWNESCISLKNEHEWWWSTLNVLRDNTLVILSNISSHLDLSPFPEEVSLPILDGLLHWVVCPSSYAQDPLPSRSPSSVLSPQRLCLETLCKLSVLSSNVDLIIATPPWSRIENLFAFLTKSLSCGQDQILREFAVVLLSNISQTDSVAARTIAEQSCCISYLIAFIEEAEANAFQIASSQGTKKLRDKPELMGTTPGMVQRAANTLKNLALVPENRVLFMRYQPQLLSLVMSQVMDQELSAIIADVLFYCSDDVMGDISSHLPIS